jgi:hypothetical protein
MLLSSVGRRHRKTLLTQKIVGLCVRQQQSLKEFIYTVLLMAVELMDDQ